MRRPTDARGALIAAVLAVSTGMPGALGRAEAAVSPWVDHEESGVRLVAAGNIAGRAETLNLGLQFHLQPGWKIYWRSPGEAGLPPVVDWGGSENLAEARIAWPIPRRFSLFGLETFGYSDEVVLPIDARLDRPGEGVLLRAKVDYLVCSEICIPREAALRLDLPAGPGAPSGDSFLIDSFRTLIPGDGAAVGLVLEQAVLTGEVARPALRVTARSRIAFQAPDVLIEGPPGFTFGKPEFTLRDRGKTAVLTVAVLSSLDDVVLEGKRLTLTLTDGRRGMETAVIARFADPSGGADGAGLGGAALVSILGLALLGGLILNLMPCVLPVLSIKLLSVVNQGGRDQAAVRASFLASAAGIVASFALLAGAAIALKAGGMTVGWGIQFQQPLFLTAMALVTTLFAYNLFGFFEITVPGWIQGLASFGPGAGGAQAGDQRHGLAGAFLTGAFATLLATPCSAPFLGTAVGFALARGPVEILAIFAMLGLGLALPYLAIAAAPALASRLPRPGAWMATLRRILGLALAATGAWLLSVLAAQVGLPMAIAVAGLLLGLGFVLRFGRAPRELRFATPILAGLLAVAAVALPAGFSTPMDPGRDAGSERGDATRWRPLDRDAIPALVAAGKVVFVDVTADWCITCQVNKSLVLGNDRVRDRLGALDVVTMRGDWTLPKEDISDYLESFGRYGIPFDAVYGPGLPDGLALSEILSVEAVLGALERAAGG